MTDEKLIEEAAKAIYALDPDRQGWDGDAYGFLESGAERGRKRAIAQARAALAVFEKAHTPTDDELALAERLVGRMLPKNTTVAPDTAANVARYLTEAGLLRGSVVPEPSAGDEIDPEECKACGEAGDEYRCIAEPQAEPSHTQVAERGRHWWACAVNAPRADWAGPCDCDLSRNPSLTEHPAALRAAGVGGASVDPALIPTCRACSLSWGECTCPEFDPDPREDAAA